MSFASGQTNSINKSKAIMDADNKASALSWWNSLPGGKKRYLKEHTRLTTPELITRFWLANIKPV